MKFSPQATVHLNYKLMPGEKHTEALYSYCNHLWLDPDRIHIIPSEVHEEDADMTVYFDSIFGSDSFHERYQEWVKKNGDIVTNELKLVLSGARVTFSFDPDADWRAKLVETVREVANTEVEVVN